MTSAQMLARRCLKLARDLLTIAEQAMPDSYFESDPRCAHARETLRVLDEAARRRRKLPRWQVWSEGFRATGESGGAVLHGEVEAKTFREACRKLLGDEPTYEPKNNTLWACRLFDNERDARRSFG